MNSFDIDKETRRILKKESVAFGTRGGHQVLMFRFLIPLSMKLIFIAVRTSPPLLK